MESLAGAEDAQIDPVLSADLAFHESDAIVFGYACVEQRQGRNYAMPEHTQLEFRGEFGERESQGFSRVIILLYL